MSLSLYSDPLDYVTPMRAQDEERVGRAVKAWFDQADVNGPPAHPLAYALIDGWSDQWIETVLEACPRPLGEIRLGQNDGEGLMNYLLGTGRSGPWIEPLLNAGLTETYIPERDGDLPLLGRWIESSYRLGSEQSLQQWAVHMKMLLRPGMPWLDQLNAPLLGVHEVGGPSQMHEGTLLHLALGQYVEWCNRLAWRPSASVQPLHLLVTTIQKLVQAGANPQAMAQIVPHRANEAVPMNALMYLQAHEPKPSALSAWLAAWLLENEVSSGPKEGARRPRL